MCGILGYIAKHELTGNELTSFFEGLDHLKKRGPDNAHTYSNHHVLLGHTRLSIIDTSASADQPFFFEQFICVFNGEIYNYQTLKSELLSLGHTFVTTSDTEVFVHAYAQRGKECFDKCDGMWSCAFYDTLKNTIVLSRDRIGEKPLYYGIFGSVFLFGSELPALLEMVKEEKCTPDYLALSNFNTYNFKHIPAPFTPYKEINKLLPGHCLLLDTKTLNTTLEKYFIIHSRHIEKNPVDQLEKILSQAVIQTCHADVPVGILLSGGIDSSLTAALLKDRNIMTYSLGYDEYDPETIRAKAIANHLGIPNKTIYFKEIIQNQSLFAGIQENIKHLGEPINLFQIFYSDILLQEMKKDGIKVVVGGNGADELFYGYNGMNKLKLISDIYDTIPFINKILSSEWIKSQLYKHALEKKYYINKEFKKFIYKDIFQKAAITIPSKKLIDIFSWIGCTIENEHSITLVADLSGAKNGMEIRSPYLNKEVIYFAHALPLQEKITSYTDPKHNKSILKRLLCRYLPEEMVYQKKMGFGYTVSQQMLLDMLHEDIIFYTKTHDFSLEYFGRFPDKKQIDIKNIQIIFEALIMHIRAIESNLTNDNIIKKLYDFKIT